VQALYLSLSRNGIDVWLDRHELQPAQEWDREIRQAIKSSAAFVVCISKAWLRRSEDSYVKKEYSVAVEEAGRRRKRYLFPALIEHCRLPKDFAFQVAPLIGSNRTARVERFAVTVRSAIGSSG